MSPNKLFLRILAWIAYVWITIRVLFVEVPPLLREASTSTNSFAILVVILWVVFSAWAAYSWWFHKQAKSKKDSK